jgi:inner membrane protein
LLIRLGPLTASKCAQALATLCSQLNAISYSGADLVLRYKVKVVPTCLILPYVWSPGHRVNYLARTAAIGMGSSSTTMNLGNRTRHLVLPVQLAGLIRWQARLVSSRRVSLCLVAAVVTVDFSIPWHGMSFVPRAWIDEPCAIATALVVLGAITRFRGTPPDPKFGWSMLAWSVLIDIDHLPQQFGSSVLTAGTPRPYTHALWVVVVLIVAAVIARRWSRRAQTRASATTVNVLAGSAWGISAHFLRDVATAPMSLWWPLTKAAVQVPYWSYVLELLIIVALPPLRWRNNVTEERTSERAVLFCDDRTSQHSKCNTELERT